MTSVEQNIIRFLRTRRVPVSMSAIGSKLEDANTTRLDVYVAVRDLRERGVIAVERVEHGRCSRARKTYCTLVQADDEVAA